MGILSSQRLWFEIAPRNLDADGGTRGELTISSTKGFHVKQKINLNAPGQNTLVGEVKRVINETLMIIGPICPELTKTLDLSAFTVANGATISAPEQKRPTINIEKNQTDRFEHEEEPIMAKRVILVDTNGCLVDPAGGDSDANISVDLLERMV